MTKQFVPLSGYWAVYKDLGPNRYFVQHVAGVIQKADGEWVFCHPIDNTPRLRQIDDMENLVGVFYTNQKLSEGIYTRNTLHDFFSDFISLAVRKYGDKA